jgi:aspartate dehydrogenase
MNASITLIGYGAITQGILERLPTYIRVSHVVVRTDKIAATQATVPVGVVAIDTVPNDATLVLECAGHSAINEHVLPALKRGIACGVLSVGALSEAGLPEALAAAATEGRGINPACQVHLLSGAIGAIDALTAAKLGGLTSVTYTGRKPPAGWRGSPAEAACDLSALTEPFVFLQASARDAARHYPKNANVAATVSLAGLGLDATQVRLVADPTVTENVHEVHAVGTFGSFKLEMRGNPLPSNPKTSMLTVLSALRFLSNQANAITI